MTTTAAIVTTLRQPGPGLASFLKYHSAIGFSRFFLFFDDPADPYLDTAEKFQQTRIIKSDGVLRRQWEQTKTARTNPSFYRYVDKELKVRQTLNVEIAIKLARAEKIDWLLHIDCDELFYPLKGDALSHFSAAAALKRSNLIYPNLEGVPEFVDIADCFKTVTLFKRNFWLSKDRLDSRQQQLIKKVTQFPERLFLFYANGKSAARVTASLEPDGGHRFRYADQNRNQAKNPRAKGAVVSRDAVILHYPCCGFKNFWRKYKMLGAFGDRWFDTVEITQAIGSFHLESRDAVAHGQTAARAFYQTRAVISEQELIQRLLDRNICCRVAGPSKFLKSKAANIQ